MSVWKHMKSRELHLAFFSISIRLPIYLDTACFRLKKDYEELKSICQKQLNNEDELKRAYDQALDCIRERDNRYAKFKHYVDLYICQ